MPRVLAMFVLALLAIVAATLLKGQSAARGDTYRPKRKPWYDDAKRGRDDAVETLHVVDEAELVGVRDALSSAPIIATVDASANPYSNSAASLFRCGGCLAFYRRDSVDALQTSNHGRCIACGSADLAAVSVARRTA
jgi:hypothetical protein